MNQSHGFTTRLAAGTLYHGIILSCCLALADEPTVVVPSDQVQERGVLPKIDLNQTFKKTLPPTQSGGSPPAHLCRAETKLLTQCKCFNQAECQALTALFPNSCSVGSTHCEFVPMSRGSMPPLPPNLCGYQVPLSVTECSCSTTADCALLSSFCPGSCPPGSQSCTCRPMRRGN